jgi:enoyl-CoA hydratase
MSSAGHIRFERDAASNAIARVTIANPGRLNALTRLMWRELRAIFEGLAERESELRAVIVQGENGHFAAGADLEEFEQFHFDPDEARAFHEREPAPALYAMLACDVPLIAQIDGVCIGGGLEIAACCDLRIAGASSRFGAPIAKLGFPMAPDELALMLDVFGRATMTELLLEARVVDAAHALQRGLVHRVVADTDLRAEAQASAERIATLPPLAARINKQTLRQLAEHAQPARLNEAQRVAHFRYASSDEHRDGIAAFLKRD